MQYSSAMRNRLRRVEGQVRGVLAMMEKGRDCQEVVTQLAAIRSAVDKTIAAIVAENLEACLRAQWEKQEDTSATVQAAIQLLIRSR
ncbi:MAG: metal-sensitive transcriptional regulator [Alicyclobacillus sp.]|nr:metal-sensitive transcriptional regulator [Alicyclobacillus sp.]